MKPWEKYQPQAEAKPWEKYQGTPAGGLVENIKSDLSNRMQQIQTAEQETAAGRQSVLERELQQTGSVIGGAGDVMGNIIGSGASSLYGIIPQQYKEPLERKAGEMAASPVGHAILGALGKGVEKYGELEQESPRAARNIGAIGNIATVGIPAAARGEKIAESGMGIGKALAQKFKPVEKMTSEELRKIGGNLFKKADQMGGSFTPQLMQRLNQEITNVLDLPITPNEMAIARSNLSPSVAAKIKIKEAMENLQSTGQPLSLREVQSLDEALGDAAFSSVDNRGIVDKAGMQYLDAQHALRNTIENAGAQDLVNKGAFDTVKEARKYWAASLRLRDIEKIIETSLNREVPATSLKNGFIALKNSKQFRSYTKAEQEAISEAAKTGALTGLLKTMGSRLVPIASGAGAGAATMNPAVGLATSAATYGAGALARGAATATQLKKARIVEDLIRQRVGQAGVDAPLSPAIVKGLKEIGITTIPAGGASEVLKMLEEMRNSANVEQGEE